MNTTSSHAFPQMHTNQALSTVSEGFHDRICSWFHHHHYGGPTHGPTGGKGSKEAWRIGFKALHKCFIIIRCPASQQKTSSRKSNAWDHRVHKSNEACMPMNVWKLSSGLICPDWVLLPCHMGYKSHMSITLTAWSFSQQSLCACAGCACACVPKCFHMPGMDVEVTTPWGKPWNLQYGYMASGMFCFDLAIKCA